MVTEQRLPFLQVVPGGPDIHYCSSACRLLFEHREGNIAECSPNHLSLPTGVAWFLEPASVAWLTPPGKSESGSLGAINRGRVQCKIFRKTFPIPNNLERKHPSFLTTQSFFEACENLKRLGYFTKESV